VSSQQVPFPNRDYEALLLNCFEELSLVESAKLCAPADTLPAGQVDSPQRCNHRR
jgi:hypothetical protein